MFYLSPANHFTLGKKPRTKRMHCIPLRHTSDRSVRRSNSNMTGEIIICKRISRGAWGAIPVFLLLCTGQVAAQEYPARYMGGPAKTRDTGFGTGNNVAMRAAVLRILPVGACQNEVAETVSACTTLEEASLRCAGRLQHRAVGRRGLPEGVRERTGYRC